MKKVDGMQDFHPVFRNSYIKEEMHHIPIDSIPLRLELASRMIALNHHLDLDEDEGDEYIKYEANIMSKHALAIADALIAEHNKTCEVKS